MRLAAPPCKTLRWRTLSLFGVCDDVQPDHSVDRSAVSTPAPAPDDYLRQVMAELKKFDRAHPPNALQRPELHRARQTGNTRHAGAVNDRQPLRRYNIGQN